MEGRGVTNYSTNKPSYGFSTATTEFDDALISKGIVTFEQAMIAKGASPEEALRLAELHEHELSTISNDFDDVSGRQNNKKQSANGNRSASDDSAEEDDDQDFIKQYRQMRLKELKAHSKKYGGVLHITKSDWNREVNEASKDGLWVIVNLARSSSCLSEGHDELCDKAQQIMIELADRFDGIKFVSIPSNSAIENWPVENLPTLFCYQFGKLQHQLIGIAAFGGVGMTRERVEWRLAKLGVLQTELEGDPKPSSSSYSRQQHSNIMCTTAGRFATESDDESDYENVD